MYFEEMWFFILDIRKGGRDECEKSFEYFTEKKSRRIML